MATVEQLELKPKDHAIWVSTRKETPGAVIGGVPIDSDEAKIQITAGEVLEVKSYATRFKVLWVWRNHEPNPLRDWEEVGSEVEIHSRFRNFISEEDDTRLQEQFQNAGLRIQQTIDLESKDIVFEVVELSR